MKFIGIILLLLTSIFLIACSANQASNKISNSELENLASKYGGVYIFNQKFVEEIEKREKERSDYMDDFFKNNKRNFKRDDLAIMDKKFPLTLSNGKEYYTSWVDYENKTGKKAKISKEFADKIKGFIGLENYNKFKPHMLLSEFYISNDEIIPISISLYYDVVKKSYGIYGDEGAGIKFSKKYIVDIGGNNVFYFDSSKNTFVKEK
ncbi:tRNA 2-selenouridine synthase [Campylobacter concisus]|uniref:tRNA 2-selenouridine synthase n=1 Tax=Campylobacter concisus TaxID=199 RepID=UPI00122C89D5|nr:tRNA 2-selenouridine synthase [Campylobacter concisus]